MRTFDAMLAQRFVLGDGAMGTQLMLSKAFKGISPEDANLNNPERVRAIHEGYVSAGSDYISTTSSGGSKAKLEKRDMFGVVNEVNRIAAQVARDAAGDAVLVAGSIGPMGEILALSGGEIEYDDAVRMFADQAAALQEGGADFFLVETMYDLHEVKAALEGIRRVSRLPAVCTMSFDMKLKTMMGVAPSRAVRTIAEWDVTVIGANCAYGPPEFRTILTQMKESAPPGVLLMGQPNAGMPTLENLEMHYDVGPDAMAEYAQWCVDNEIKVIGGCCGTTPAHIEAMAAVVNRNR